MSVHLQGIIAKKRMTPTPSPSLAEQNAGGFPLSYTAGFYSIESTWAESSFHSHWQLATLKIIGSEESLITK
jgi:hypothetical protein